ncbi:LysR family transcriptional regulator [Actinophytocola sp.]|uniref:LysR family transcriptional regulator n=1 Tax=Actinophytocola sp. TaxID=1872138 RepID=UPI002D656994|nr:LysR family transcriptional regulator [Actinophytocola sp.]HYQ69947.1 LysR family transcriptional regulator [Actinophytocola sp.]
MELDLGAVRAFVAVADELHFGAAADRLGLTQQAVSKRVAKLEAALGATLLDRAPTGTVPTKDGATFLPHARALVALADQAKAAVRTGPLRVDVLGTRLATTELIRAFHETNDDVEIHIVTGGTGGRTAREALLRGTIDAAFARVAGELAPQLAHTPACLDPHQLVCGRGHPLATRPEVRLAELTDSVTWLPGYNPDTEWADLYEEMRREFPLTIDTGGPNFGLDHLLDTVAASENRHFFGGEFMRIPWHAGIVRIPIVDPTPVYPWSMVWHRDNRHPALPRLIEYVETTYEPYDPTRHWLPRADRQVM